MQQTEGAGGESPTDLASLWATLAPLTNALFCLAMGEQ